MTIVELKTLANKLFAEHKLEGWKFEITKRVGTRYLGRCYPTQKKIVISLWHIIQNKPELEQTLRHEIAHALDWIRFRRCGHGPTWKLCCMDVGARPDRICTNGRPLWRVKGSCPECSKEFYRLRKPRRLLVCVKCVAAKGLGNVRFITWENLEVIVTKDIHV